MYKRQVPDIPETGEYAVYVSYQTLPGSVSDAKYLVFHNGGCLLYTSTLSKKSERVSSSAGQLIISIKTNRAPWNITDISPWLKVSPEKGDNDTCLLYTSIL